MLSQGIKSRSFFFKPQVNSLSILNTLKTSQKDSIKAVQHNTDSSYHRIRKKTVKFLIQSAEKFEFSQETKHYAIALLDTLLF